MTRFVYVKARLVGVGFCCRYNPAAAAFKKRLDRRSDRSETARDFVVSDLIISRIETLEDFATAISAYLGSDGNFFSGSAANTSSFPSETITAGVGI